jgi:hypothetical protein
LVAAPEAITWRGLGDPTTTRDAICKKRSDFAALQTKSSKRPTLHFVKGFERQSQGNRLNTSTRR